MDQGEQGNRIPGGHDGAEGGRTNRKNHFKVEDLDALIVEEVKKLSLDPAALDALLQGGTGKPGPDVAKEWPYFALIARTTSERD